MKEIDPNLRRPGEPAPALDLPAPAPVPDPEWIDLIGIPYSRTHDCNWLAAFMANRFGLFCPEVKTPDDRREWNATFVQVLTEHYRGIDGPVAGALMVHELRDFHKKIHWHASTVLPGCKKFITTREEIGVHTVLLTDRAWRIYFRGYYWPVCDRPESGKRSEESEA
jgi:hypothetical protein